MSGTDQRVPGSHVQSRTERARSRTPTRRGKNASSCWPRSTKPHGYDSISCRRVHLELAKKRGWPALCILPERNLREVARLAPASLEQFANIVGEKRAAEYGQAFLDAIGSGGPPR